MMERKIYFTAILFAAILFSVNKQANAQKTVDMCNVRDLRNWEFVLKDEAFDASEIFIVEDGVITIDGNPFGYMYTRDTYSDFTLYVEWRWLEEKGNSGIFLFVQDDHKVWPNAVECQLQDGNAGDFVLLGGSSLAEFKTPKGESRPAFPVVKKRSASSENLAGEWNNAYITCEKGKITVYINGVLQNKGSKPMYKSGHIALQSEGAPIQFRNVRITPLAKE